jgi:hypothetical protein
MLTTSVNYTAAADKPENDRLAEFVAAGPAAALSRDATGRVSAKRQADAAVAEFADSVAKSLNEGSTQGYLRVERDLSVTLTDKGREFAIRTIDEQTHGCDRVLSVTADWLGFHLDLESTCTEQEFHDRNGTEALPDQAAQAPTIAAAGLSAPIPAPPVSDHSSHTTSCLASLGTLAVGLFTVAIAVASPITGWVVFWLTWARAGAATFTAAILVVHHCGQLLQVQNRVGPTTYVCGRSYYAYYRWSSYYGQYVPTYVSYVCP